MSVKTGRSDGLRLGGTGSPGSSIGAFRSFCLTALVIILPLVLLAFWYQDMWSRRQARLAEEQERWLGRVLSGYAARSDTGNFMGDLLRRFERRVFDSGSPQRTFRLLTKRMKKRFPGVFRFTFIDGKGEAVKPLCDIAVPGRMMRRFFLTYLQFLDGRPEEFFRGKGFVASFFGPFVPQELEIHGHLLLARPDTESRFIYVSKPSGKGMFTAHLNLPPTWKEMGVRARVEGVNRGRVSRNTLPVLTEERGSRKTPLREPQVRGPRNTTAGRSGSLELFLGGTSSPDIASAAAFFRIPVELERSLQERFDRNPGCVIREGGFLWARQAVFPGVFLLGRMRPHSNVGAERERTQVMGFLCFGGAFLSVFFMGFAGQRSWPAFQSVRSKLLMAFLFVTGLPLLMMGVTSGRFLAERREVLRHQLQRSAENALNSFDRSFPQSLQKLEDGIRKLVPSTLAGSVGEGKGLFEKVLSGKPGLDWNAFKLFHGGGQGFFIDEAARVETARFRNGLKVIDRISRTVLRHLNSQVSVQAPRQVAFSGSPEFSEEGVHEIFVSTILGSLDRLGSFDLGANRFLILFRPIFNREGLATFLSFFIWSRNTLERAFILHNRSRLERQIGDTRLLAFDLESPEESVPPGDPLLSTLRDWSSQVIDPGRGYFSSLRIGAKRVHVTAIHGKELSRYVLVAVTSDRFLAFEIRRLGFFLASMGVSMLAICLTVGGLLVWRLLRPLGPLSDGIESLRNRKFFVPIPVSGNDEIGRLSLSFNQIGEGLEDLETAGFIQKHFLPEGPGKAGDWVISGYCRFASGFGRTFYDHFRLPDGRWLLFAAEAEDTGFTGAMVLGMAKAVLGHPEVRSDPGTFFHALDALLSQPRRVKRRIRGLIGLFEPGTGKLEWENRGFPDPMILATGRVGDCEPGSDLTPFVAAPPRFLAPNEAFVLLSDASSKALKRSPGNLSELVSEAPFRPLKKAGGEIRERRAFERIGEETVQTGSDFMVLVLKRLQPAERAGGEA